MAKSSWRGDKGEGRCSQVTPVFSACRKPLCRVLSFSGSLQARYDTVYAQCMAAKGNRVGGPPGPGPVYAYPPPAYDYYDPSW